MEKSVQTAIEERAHQIWEAEGRPVGRDLEHWQRAKAEFWDKFEISADPVERKAIATLTSLSQDQRQLVEEYFADVRRRKLVFLLAGKTGVGKSTTINTLLGKEVAEVSRLEPCTATVHPYPGKGLFRCFRCNQHLVGSSLKTAPSHQMWAVPEPEG